MIAETNAYVTVQEDTEWKRMAKKQWPWNTTTEKETHSMVYMETNDW